MSSPSALSSKASFVHDASEKQRLPIPLTLLIGREQEIAQLRQILRHNVLNVNKREMPRLKRQQPLQGETSSRNVGAQLTTDEQSPSAHLQQHEQPTSDLVVAFSPQAIALLEIALDDLKHSRVRAAASMLYLLHPAHDGAQVAQLMKLLVDLYQPDHGSWYLSAAAVSLENFISHGDALAIRYLDELVQRAQYDFDGRVGLDPILDRWRQTSKAPVLRSHPTTLWD